MKKITSSFLACAIGLSMSLQTYAATPPQDIRLENYLIDPQVDFSWMTPDERAAYVAFLYSLQILVDAELSGSMVVDSENTAKQTSKFELMRKLLQPAVGVEEADAFLPLIPIGEALIATGVRLMAPRAIAYAASRAVVTTAARREIFMGAAEVVANPALTTTATTAAATTAAASTTSWVGTAAIGTAVTGASLAMQPSELHDGKVTPAPAAKQNGVTDKQKEKTDAVASSKTADQKEKTPYKQVGQFCLFGCYPSKYVKSGSRMVCPGPASAVNNTICKDTPSPSFLCQSMGLSENAKMEQVTNKLCVPLLSKEKGLTNISVRCSEAFVNKFLPAVKALSVADLKSAQETIQKGIAQLESEKGISNVGYLKYCESKNSVNKANQAKPCEALQQIMTEFKKLAPTFTKQVELAANSKNGSDKKVQPAVKTTN